MLSLSAVSFLLDLLDRPAHRNGASPTGWSAMKHPSDRGPVEHGDTTARPRVNAARTGISFDRF